MNRIFPRLSRATLTATLVAILLPGSLLGAEQVTLKFAKSSSSYYQMTVQLAEVLNKNGFSSTVEESQGSVQNVNEAVLRDKNYIFSTPYGLVKNAQAGEKPFRANDKFQTIRSLFPAPALTMHYVFSDRIKARQFSELTTESVLIGKGTFSAKEAEKTFADFGLTQLKLIDVELNSAPDALKNGKIDGYVTASPWPTPSVMEAAVSIPVFMMSMSEAELAKTGREKAVIPKTAYPKMTADVTTTSLPVGIRTTTAMSEETAYQITKLFWENKAKLEKINAYWSGVTPETLGSIKGQWHDGAKKYYLEKGWIKE